VGVKTGPRGGVDFSKEQSGFLTTEEGGPRKRDAGRQTSLSGSNNVDWV